MLITALDTSLIHTVGLWGQKQVWGSPNWSGSALVRQALRISEFFGPETRFARGVAAWHLFEALGEKPKTS